MNSQKHVKNQKSTYKHSSFDGLIQEDIDLSDTYLAVNSMKQIESHKSHMIIFGITV